MKNYNCDIILILLVIINVTTGKYVSNREANDQDIYQEPANNVQASINVEDRLLKSRSTRSTHDYHIDMQRANIKKINLVFKERGLKELKLVFNENKKSYRADQNSKDTQCKLTGKCNIARSNDANNKVIKDELQDENTPVTKRDHIGVKKLTVDDDKIIHIESLVDHLKNVLLPNENEHESRCDGKDCGSGKDKIDSEDRLDNDRNNNAAISIEEDDHKDFSQEAINDWANFKGKQSCIGNQCKAISHKNVDLGNRKTHEILRKRVHRYNTVSSILDKSSEDYVNIPLEPGFESPEVTETVLKDHDFFNLLEKLKNLYAEKLFWYVQNPYLQSLARFNLNKDITESLRKLKNMYQNDGTSDEHVREAYENVLKVIVGKQFLPFKIRNNAFYEFQDLLKDLQQHELEALRAELIRERKSFLPLTKQLEKDIINQNRNLLVNVKRTIEVVRRAVGQANPKVTIKT